MLYMFEQSSMETSSIKMYLTFFRGMTRAAGAQMMGAVGAQTTQPAGTQTTSPAGARMTGK